MESSGDYSDSCVSVVGSSPHLDVVADLLMLEADTESTESKPSVKDPVMCEFDELWAMDSESARLNGITLLADEKFDFVDISLDSSSEAVAPGCTPPNSPDQWVFPRPNKTTPPLGGCGSPDEWVFPRLIKTTPLESTLKAMPPRNNAAVPTRKTLPDQKQVEEWVLSKLFATTRCHKGATSKITFSGLPDDPILSPLDASKDMAFGVGVTRTLDSDAFDCNVAYSIGSDGKGKSVEVGSNKELDTSASSMGSRMSGCSSKSSTDGTLQRSLGTSLVSRVVVGSNKELDTSASSMASSGGSSKSSTNGKTSSISTRPRKAPAKTGIANAKRERSKLPIPAPKHLSKRPSIKPSLLPRGGVKGRTLIPPSDAKKRIPSAKVKTSAPMPSDAQAFKSKLVKPAIPGSWRQGGGVASAPAPRINTKTVTKTFRSQSIPKPDLDSVQCSIAAVTCIPSVGVAVPSVGVAVSSVGVAVSSMGVAVPSVGGGLAESLPVKEAKCESEEGIKAVAKKRRHNEVDETSPSKITDMCTAPKTKVSTVVEGVDVGKNEGAVPCGPAVVEGVAAGSSKPEEVPLVTPKSRVGRRSLIPTPCGQRKENSFNLKSPIKFNPSVEENLPRMLFRHKPADEDSSTGVSPLLDDPVVVVVVGKENSGLPVPRKLVKPRMRGSGLERPSAGRLPGKRGGGSLGGALRGRRGPFRPLNGLCGRQEEEEKPSETSSSGPSYNIMEDSGLVPHTKVVHSPADKENASSTPCSKWSPIRKTASNLDQSCYRCTKRPNH